jgi:orotidine-5'-phosphate decarboxylase
MAEGGKEMTYQELLCTSAKDVGNCTCMGLDPQLSCLSGEDSEPVRDRLNTYYRQLFRRMNLSGLAPAAFKPNIGFFALLDHPREEDFSGSQALSDVLDMVENFFPGIPVILDAKRGDIARSSQNYAIEAFDVWGVDSVTVAPYMGTDSVSPFSAYGPEKGVYVLNRTSNPGGKDLQDLICGDGPLYLQVARLIQTWKTGAVVGATNMQELGDLVSFYQKSPVPLLIPGVGSQGGSATQVMEVLRSHGYPLELVRINSSSGLTQPWKHGPAPEDWLDQCIAAIRTLTEETAL